MEQDEDVYVENNPKGHDQCHYYHKCLWCELRYKEKDANRENKPDC